MQSRWGTLQGTSLLHNSCCEKVDKLQQQIRITSSRVSKQGTDRTYLDWLERCDRPSCCTALSALHANSTVRCTRRRWLPALVSACSDIPTKINTTFNTRQQFHVPLNTQRVLLDNRRHYWKEKLSYCWHTTRHLCMPMFHAMLSRALWWMIAIYWRNFVTFTHLSRIWCPQWRGSIELLGSYLVRAN